MSAVRVVVSAVSAGVSAGRLLFDGGKKIVIRNDTPACNVDHGAHNCENFACMKNANSGESTVTFFFTFHFQIRKSR